MVATSKVQFLKKVSGETERGKYCYIKVYDDSEEEILRMYAEEKLIPTLTELELVKGEEVEVSFTVRPKMNSFRLLAVEKLTD